MTHEERREAVAVFTDILTSWWQRHVVTATAASQPGGLDLSDQTSVD
jgi:hypothetical protein